MKLNLTITEAEAETLIKQIDNGTFSFAAFATDFPKAAMLFEYIYTHYPGDAGKFGNLKFLPAILFNNEYSNDELESMIDKIAIMNGWKKKLDSDTDT